MRVAAGLALLSLALGVSGRSLAAGAEPDAAELAKRAAAAAFGSDAVEIWKSDWQGQELSFGVARRHENGKLELYLRVFAPHKYDPLAFLIEARKDGLPGILYYRSPRVFPPGRLIDRTLDVEIASPLEPLPFVPGLPSLVDLWPRRAEDYAVARLADDASDGTPCRVLESRPKTEDGAYDRIVSLLAKDSDVALETRYYRGDKLVRKVTIAAADLDTSAGRAFARKRVVEKTGEPPQVLSLERFSLDPVFPDQLFTSLNLRAGRFPSY
jgi:outer membrane lipoprotein-sorting protein